MRITIMVNPFRQLQTCWYGSERVESQSKRSKPAPERWRLVLKQRQEELERERQEAQAKAEREALENLPPPAPWSTSAEHRWRFLDYSSGSYVADNHPRHKGFVRSISDLSGPPHPIIPAPTPPPHPPPDAKASEDQTLSPDTQLLGASLASAAAADAQAPFQNSQEGITKADLHVQRAKSACTRQVAQQQHISNIQRPKQQEISGCHASIIRSSAP